jgi:hypothetical protein
MGAIMTNFEVRYENGASHIVPAETAQEALVIADESLRGCLPKDFNYNNLVRVTIVRRYGFCALCGRESKSFKKINMPIGWDVVVCGDCSALM